LRLLGVFVQYLGHTVAVSVMEGSSDARCTATFQVDSGADCLVVVPFVCTAAHARALAFGAAMRAVEDIPAD
jgi:hypothetical protein